MFRKVLSYAASLYFLSMLSSGISFFVSMFLAKSILKAELGKYALYVAVYSMIGMIITSGVDRTFVKFVGERVNRYKDLVNLFLLISIFCILFFLFTGLLLAPFINHEIWMGVIAVGPFVCTQNAAYIFRGRLEQSSEIRLLVGTSLLNSVLTFTFLSFFKNEWVPILGDFLSLTIPTFILIHIFSIRVGGISFRILFSYLKSDLLKEFLKFVKPLWIAGSAYAISGQLTNFLIKKFLNFQKLGDFFFAKQMLMLIYKPIDILSKVLLAGFSIKKEVHILDFQKVISANLLMFPSVAIFVVIFIPFFLKIIGLDQYEGSEFYVALLSFSIPLICIQGIMGIVNVVLNSPEVSQKCYLLSSIFTAPVSVAIVYYFGISGAAFIPSLYNIILFFANIYFLWNIANEHAVISLKLGLIAQCVFSFFLILSLKVGTLINVWGILVAYVFVGHLFRIWNIRDNLDLLLQVVNKNNTK